MAGIIPRRKIKGVDFCGSSSHYYIIRSDLGCYMRSSDFNEGSDLSIHALHPACQHGDHYFADEKGQFYIIKGDECRRVTDLTEDTDSEVFTLHPDWQGGDHYLSAFGWYYIIFQEKGTYRRTTYLDLFQTISYRLRVLKSSYSEGTYIETTDLRNDFEFPLHSYCKDGLYYWGDLEHFYFLKPTEWGVEYFKGTSLKKAKGTVSSVHRDVLNFLPGGLSITSGPAFGKWVKIKTVSNDSPTPVTWQRKITKKVGYSKEKMSQITHNWRIEASGSISAGNLAGLIAQCQFSLSAEYGDASVNAEKENWNEETEEEEQLTFELKPNERLYVWQFQLGLGSDPVLFCRDLRITDQPNTPPEVPLSPEPKHRLQENASDFLTNYLFICFLLYLIYYCFNYST